MNKKKLRSWNWLELLVNLCVNFFVKIQMVLLYTYNIFYLLR